MTEGSPEGEGNPNEIIPYTLVPVLITHDKMNRHNCDNTMSIIITVSYDFSCLMTLMSNVADSGSEGHKERV